jgi:hypothetical protein
MVMSVNSKMTAIADAIRGKTGGTNPLTLDQMATAIAGIQTGSGGSDVADEIITRTITEYSNSRISTVGMRAFSHCISLKSISLPNVVVLEDRCFENCNRITMLNIPNVETVGDYALSSLINLEGTLALPKLKSVGIGAFQQNVKLTAGEFPVLESVSKSLFWNARKIETCDAGLSASIGETAFGNTIINTLILRKEDSVCTLSNVNAFVNTPFAAGKTGGTVYVPVALIEQYKTATNWSTLYAAGTCNFVAIEGSEYE